MARALEPYERGAFLGDQAELAVSSYRVVWEAAGLVVRRELEAWRSWRPWFGLVAIAVPLSLLAGPSLDVGRAIVGIAQSGDAPFPLVPVIPSLALMLALWAWSYNFTLTVVVRRGSQLVEACFCLLVVWMALKHLRGSSGAVETVAGFASLTVVLFLPAFFGLRAASSGFVPSLSLATALAAAPPALMIWLGFSYFGWSDAPLLGWSMEAVWARATGFIAMSWPGLWICTSAYRSPRAASIE